MYIHGGILLFGFAAPLVSIIGQPALIIASSRLLFSALTLICVKGMSLRINKQKGKMMILAGVALAVHSVTHTEDGKR